MPETREWPPRLRRLAKLSLGVIYTGSATAGWHVVLADHQEAPWWSTGLGLLAGCGGVLALVFMLLEWWMAERPAAWVVAFALSFYAIIDGARTVAYAVGWYTEGSIPDLGSTALLYVSAAAVGLRIVHLWAFDLNLNRAKERAEAARHLQTRTGPGDLV